MCPRRFRTARLRAALSRQGRAFTLLEVMISVAILAMIVLSIHRFLVLNIQAIRIGTETGNRDRSVRAVIDVLQAQLNALPLYRAQGVLRGEAYKFDEKPQDEMEWVTTAGNGLFSSHAAGDWRVTLTLRPNEETKGLDLGLRRVQVEGNPEEIHWLPLIPAMRALEIRYYDARMNNWLERWVDTNSRPALVQVRIWRADDEHPYEAILHVPSRQATGEGAQAPPTE